MITECSHYKAQNTIQCETESGSGIIGQAYSLFPAFLLSLFTISFLSSLTLLWNIHVTSKELSLYRLSNQEKKLPTDKGRSIGLLF